MFLSARFWRDFRSLSVAVYRGPKISIYYYDFVSITSPPCIQDTSKTDTQNGTTEKTENPEENGNRIAKPFL